MDSKWVVTVCFLFLCVYHFKTQYDTPIISAFVYIVSPIITLAYLFNQKAWNIRAKCIKHELYMGFRISKCLPRIIRSKTQKLTLADHLHEIAQKHPDRQAIIQSETGEIWTFKKLDEYANQVCHHFMSEFDAGDTVALISDNRIQHIGTWVGLVRAGLKVAFLNDNLQGDGLAHTIKIANGKAVIVARPFLKNLETIAIGNVVVYGLGDEKSDSTIPTKDLLEIVSKSSTSYPTKLRKPASFEDTCCYLYTSGTTGYPKAVRQTHAHLMKTSLLKNVYKLGQYERIYCSLPLYHGNALFFVTCQLIFQGWTAIQRRKFSVRNFWSDCAKYEATGFNYIGEICRYLASQAPSDNDKNHKVTFCVGNGMRADIWPEFTERFGLKRVCEFYGQSEGVAIINDECRPGRVGFLFNGLAPMFIVLVKVDEDNVPIRGDDGLCVVCESGETGMLMMKQVGSLKAASYTDPKQTAKKIVRDVWKKGDVYFNSGDLLVADEEGWCRFLDRTGDTFRWKGENVSTSEVEAVAQKVLDNTKLVATCVSCLVPGEDGSAGLLVIEDSEKLGVPVEKLMTGMAAHLPKYAMPVFIRVTDKLPVTGTYKIQKNTVKNVGFDLEKMSEGDRVWFLQRAKYEEMGRPEFMKIKNKEVRF